MSQLVVLAAGMGRRLGKLTEGRPKALVDVAGEPLIAHTLRFAREVGLARRVVVAGYLAAQLRASVASVDPEADVVVNDEYRSGNVLSLAAGHAELGAGGFLLMNADHIYGRGVADIVRGVVARASEVTAFVDFDRTLGPDDMKVELEGGSVLRMAKALERWDAGYVGMTFVPSGRRGAYDEVLRHAVARHGESVNVEQLLNDLTERSIAPATADVSGIGWWEVDDASDRDAADEALRA